MLLQYANVENVLVLFWLCYNLTETCSWFYISTYPSVCCRLVWLYISTRGLLSQRWYYQLLLQVTKTANANVEIGGIEAYAIASHTAPVFTANANVETGSIYGYGNCEFTTVVRTANVNVETGGIYGYADTTSIAPIFSATATCVVDNIYVDILMTHQPPVFTANATVNVGSIIGYGNTQILQKHLLVP